MLSIIVVLFSISCAKCLDVDTSSGTVRGLTLSVLDRTVHQFLSVPYAEPPVRFEKPEPKRHVQALIDTTKPGPSCFQVGVSSHDNESEDCLSLNVWSPTTANTSEPMPVMFYLYGGGFTQGSINLLLYNGSLLAAHDVVVVSANYRLGMFGWLYIDDNHSNAGLYDQLLALQWVRQNIRHFGGDPNRVTLFGQSAGSWSISAHIMSPHARGLFQRAILESGTIFWNKNVPLLSKAQALKIGHDLAANFNCSAPEWVDCLRKVDAEALSECPVKLYPIPETDYIPALAQEAFKRGNFSQDVDIMIGVTKDEGAILAHIFYPESDNVTTVLSFEEMVRKTRDPELNVQNITDHYLKNVDPSNETAIRWAYYDFYGDVHEVCPTYFFGKRFAEVSAQRKVYFYEWTQTGPLTRLECEGFGVCHGSELEYLFGLDVVYNVSQSDRQFSLDTMKMWTNFAKNKNPLDGLERKGKWPRMLDPKLPNTTYIKELNPNSSRILENLFQYNCEIFWKDYFI